MSEQPVRLLISAPTSALATGAYLKNRACLIHNRSLHWSSMNGDLCEPQACIALDQSVDRLCQLAKATPAALPAVLAHDMHPDFYSSRLAVAVANRIGVPVIPVQHHHAHIASTIAESAIRTPVIGIALDGFGYGSDGRAWGGEVLWVDGGHSAHRWRRLAHLHPISQPGGDKAVQEPWRLAAAVLHDSGRGDEIETRFAPRVGRQASHIVGNMLEQGFHCPTSSSAGRWFDAAAAALGLITHQSYEGEAAALLENCAQQFLQQQPDFHVPWTSLDLRPIVASLFDIDPANSTDVTRGAAVFHLALISTLAHAANVAAREQVVLDVILGGGCFVNRVLRERLTDALQQAGLRVHVPAVSLCGDISLAIGQAWVAACTLHETANKASRPSGPDSISHETTEHSMSSGTIHSSNNYSNNPRGIY